MNKTHKQLTSFWNLIRNHKIVIPIIQRDYAQGRENESTLRTRFLTKLKQTLESAIITSKEVSNTSHYHQLILDFVYGTPTTTGAIAPLDGQQRLTTLWLLHWYLAYITGELTDNVKKILKSFSYETRVSSREFCEKLCDLTPLENKNDSIKAHIENQTWFYSEWKQDPTVSGMLTMLFGNQQDSKDNISAIFGRSNIDKLNKYWELLTSNESAHAPIMFNHTIIGTEELPLSDDLYIKMNARGKPLTNFENFKAETIKWIAEHISKEESIRIASKFDNEWTDIFWEKGLGMRVHNIDELFYAFINRIYYQYIITEKRNDAFVLTDKSSTTNEDYQFFSGSGNSSKTDKLISFQSLERYTSRLTNTLSDIETIFQGIRQLDSSSFQVNWKKNFFYIPQYILDKDNTPKPLTNDILDFTTINQQERVAFYAICKYFLTPSSNNDESESLSHWIRFIWNLISDKDKGGADTIRSISAIQQAITLINMVKNPRRVYHELYKKSSVYRQKLKTSALELRFIEEIEKIDQILDPDPEVELPSWAEDWEQAIIEAEKVRIFTGSIGMLFHNEKGETDWKNFELKLKNAKEYFKIPDDPNVIKNMIPYLSDGDIIFIFSRYSFQCKDDNISEMLRKYPTRFHKYLIGEETSDSLTRLQSDIISLCNDNPSFWIHDKWVNNKHVLSDYLYRSGSYESNSYFLGTDFIKNRYEFLKEAQSKSCDIQLILNKEYTSPYKGLCIDFTCIYSGRKYKFRWTAFDWVDMYDDDQNKNLWEEGLHSKYMGQNNNEPNFNDVPSFLSEIQRCINMYISARNNH